MHTVTELQTALNAVGYGPVKVDGIFGSYTRARVRDFQRKHHLMADGIPGTKTWAALYAVMDALKSPPVATTQPVATGAVLTAAKLKKIAPKARADIAAALVSDEATEAFVAEGINTPNNMSFFLSQAMPETGDLTKLEESLNYSVAGLRATFGRHRITDAQCAKYGRKSGQRADQEAIANIVYGGAWGASNLGNNQPGDGWKYRGSGMFQTTGRANARRAGHEQDPENLRKPLPAILSAIRFWRDNRLVVFADRNDLTGMRKRVNGGTNGMDHSREALAKAKAVLGA